MVRTAHVLAALAVAALTLPLHGQTTSAPSAPGSAAAAVGGVDWEQYFPFRLGDSWTYDWSTSGRLVPKRTSVRTRVFEGTEFLGASIGYRLVSDDGTYHLYTMTDGVLRLHSSSEAGRLLFYEPPVILAAPDWRAGEPHVTEQPDTQRHWAATIVGVESVTVPFGRVERGLTVRLDMRGPDFTSQATHVFAPKVGLVRYDYQLRDAASRTVEVEVHAELRHARLAGREVKTLADLARLPGTTDGPTAEDRSARESLKRAVERRYTWDDAFPGFSGEYELVEEGKTRQRGQFSIARDLSVKVDGGDDATRATLRNDISSFVTQRKPSSFDLTYAETTFAANRKPSGETVFTAEHDPLATIYTIKDGEVVSVGRSLGRLRYTAFERNKLKTDDGRSITVDYDVVYVSNETDKELSTEHTTDAYVKLGKYWVPAGRRIVKTANDQRSTRELRLTGLKLGG